MNAMKILFLSLLLGCSQMGKQSDIDLHRDTTKAPGAVSVFQTATSDSETSINILRPHLMNTVYEVSDPSAKVLKMKTTSGKHIHWKVDRIHITGLQANKTYRLNIYNANKYGKRLVDWREFSTFDSNKKKARFVGA